MYTVVRSTTCNMYHNQNGLSSMSMTTKGKGEQQRHADNCVGQACTYCRRNICQISKNPAALWHSDASPGPTLHTYIMSIYPTSWRVPVQFIYLNAVSDEPGCSPTPTPSDSRIIIIIIFLHMLMLVSSVSGKARVSYLKFQQCLSPRFGHHILDYDHSLTCSNECPRCAVECAQQEKQSLKLQRRSKRWEPRSRHPLHSLLPCKRPVCHSAHLTKPFFPFARGPLRTFFVFKSTRAPLAVGSPC